MYAYITGTLMTAGEESIVLDNQGIGYTIRMPARAYGQLPSVGENIKVHTYLHVREDEYSLFGFLTEDELSVFRMLIAVGGIGPKGGLAILSALSADELRMAVLCEDEKAISSAPGIGSKTAKRLIIELKDKIQPEDVLSDGAGTEWGDKKQDEGGLAREAREALTALGYSTAEASRALRGIEIPEDAALEDILKEALRQVSAL